MSGIDDLLKAAQAIERSTADKAAGHQAHQDVLAEMATALADIAAALERDAATESDEDKAESKASEAAALATALRDAMREVRIEVQAAKSPTITVQAPTVNVSAPTVNYTPPEIKLPQTQPAAVNVLPSNWDSCDIEVIEYDNGRIKKLKITKQVRK